MPVSQSEFTVDPTILYPPNSNPTPGTKKIWLERFEGMPPGGQIQSVHISKGGGEGIVTYGIGAIYQDNGTKEYRFKDTFPYGERDTGSLPGALGKYNVSKISGLPPGEIVDYMYIGASSSHGFIDYFGVIYDDAGGVPGNLLSHTRGYGATNNSQWVSMKLEEFTGGVATPIAIPDDGILWVGAYMGFAVTFYDRDVGGSGTYQVADNEGIPYSFGLQLDETVVDDPFPAGATHIDNEMMVMVRYAGDNLAPCPGTLLGQSDYVSSSGAGNTAPDYKMFTMRDPKPIVPDDGVVWGGVLTYSSLSGWKGSENVDVPYRYAATNGILDNPFDFVDYTTDPPPGIAPTLPEFVTSWQNDPSLTIFQPAQFNPKAFWTMVRLTSATGFVYSYIIG